MNKEQLVEIWSTHVEKIIGAIPKILSAAVVVLAFYIAGRLLEGTLKKVFLRFRADRVVRNLVASVARWGITILGFAVALDVMGLGGAAAGLATSLGIFTVVAGFALRNVGENFIAGIMIAFSRPFEPGDIIKSGADQGEVVEINLRYVQIKTEDNRHVYIPNSFVFTNSITKINKQHPRT